MSRICSSLGEGQAQFRKAIETHHNRPRSVLKRKRPLSRMSRLRTVEAKIYRQKRKQFLHDRPICEFDGCFKRSEDVHHKLGRGPNYLRVSTWLAICRQHHDWIHSHPNKARELGLLAPVGGNQ